MTKDVSLAPSEVRVEISKKSSGPGGQSVNLALKIEKGEVDWASYNDLSFPAGNGHLKLW